MTEWYEIRLTKRQLDFIDLLCRFHLDLSDNERAKKQTRKLMHCLKYWAKPQATGVTEND